MPETPLNLIKGDKIGSETDYRDALPVNMYAIAKPMFGSAGYMIEYSGLTLHATGLGIDRGGIWNEKQIEHYRISGNQLISVSASGSITDLGAIAGSDTASLPYSFQSQGIVAGGNFYRYSSSLGLVQMTDADLGTPIDCVWVDGFYFFTDGDSLYHTLAADEGAIDPNDFDVSQFSPDPTLGLGLTQDNKVMVFNRYTTEYFANDGTSNFSFTRLPSRAIKLGIVGTHCKVESGGKWFVLGGAKEQAVSVHIVSVGTSQKVATREIDKLIGQYTEKELSTVVVEAYEEDANSFIMIHLLNETLLFNETIAKVAGIGQAWSIIKTGTANEPYRGKHGVFDANLGKWVYGDKLGANIGILDEAVATQYGDIAEWLLFTPFYLLDSQSIDELVIEIITGHSDKGDANVFLSLSYDGVTYGRERILNYGKANNYNTRFEAYRLGHVRNWVGFKLRGATRSRMAFGRGYMING